MFFSSTYSVCEMWDIEQKTIKSNSRLDQNHDFEENSNLTRVEKITILRDQLLKCRSIQNPSQRRQIISNLKPEIASKVVQDGDSNSVSLSLITACLEFPGGLQNLLKTTEILHEKGTIQMINLWQKAKELFPEEVS